MSNLFLNKLSAKMLSELFTYFTNTLLLCLRLFSTNIWRSVMQFLQLDVVLFTIDTTAWLSQKMTILVLFKAGMFSQMMMPAHSAYSSRNSMLGSQMVKNFFDHIL